MGKLARDLWFLARTLPVFVLDGLRRWARAPHQPVEIEPGRPWCTRCRVDYPCPELLRLTPEEA